MADKFRRQSNSRESAAERYFRLVLRGVDFDPKVREAVYRCFFVADDVDQALTLSDLTVSFPALVMASDRLSSAYGLERRSPYLAHELAEFCYCLPLEYKRRAPRHTKSLLRDMAKRLGVPREVWGDQNKIGFASPLPRWLSGELAAWCQERLEAMADDTYAPALGRLVARNALSRGRHGFDRARAHALFLSLWWMGHRKRMPAASDPTDMIAAGEPGRAIRQG